MAIRYSIIIPTMRRPDAISAALASVFAQDIPAALRDQTELIVVDNCPDHSGRDGVNAVLTASPFVATLVHAGEPGVASARNLGWQTARGSVIIFLDDDQEAHDGWLKSLINSHRNAIAPILFGPIYARVPDPDDPLSAYFEARFARFGPARDEVLNDYFGCGNCLIDREALSLSEPPFSPEANHIGGEDDLLFHKLRSQGVAFGWSAGALVDEVVPAARATIAYTLRRAFAYGQGPSQSCANQERPDWKGVLGWMVVGLGQVMIFAPLALLQWPFRRVNAMKAADRAAQGLGKLFWMPVFEPKFYGTALLKPRS